MHTAVPPSDIVDGYYRFFYRHWSPVILEKDVPNDEPISVLLLDQPLVVARLDGEVAVMEDCCRHFQTALSLGSVEHNACGTQVLRCKYHGWAFDKSGECVEIPQLNKDRRIPGDAKVQSYPVVIKHGIIWTKMENGSSCFVPDIPGQAEEGLHVLPTQVTRWDCSAVRMILSALDDYHFAFLHEGVLGDRSHPEAPERTISRVENSLLSRFSVVQPANITNAPTGYVGDEVKVDYTMRVDMPNIISLTKRNPLGAYVVWFATCPRSIRQTDVFWTVARSYDLEPGSDERVIQMESMIQSQDRPIIASQRPWISAPLPIRDVDDALVGYLKWLAEMGCPTSV